ncbi:MAG: tetratricopeptide repeat protein, partial [Microcystaceae cyanobacterium]
MVIDFLETFGIQETGKFVPILEKLKKHLFLNNQGKVAVEFIRQWLLKEHPIKRSQSLDQSLRELENVDPEASNLFAIATMLDHQGKKENAYILYEQVLGINPNHFQALFRLAEQSLEKEDFKQAIEYYARAYQFDPLQHKEGYVKSLLGYGDQLWNQKNKSQN